ncbi:MAG: transporter substrate-binding domain-containing protein [Clostridiales bacterium]|nr:transporter substrate-binding domain-containing protein [Clostridiales bacterium]
MKKKVLIALLVVAIISVSVMAFAGCDNKVKVGYQSGTTGQFYTAEHINLKPMGYTNAALAVENMIAGRIEYVITDIAPAKSIASLDKYKDKVKVIDIGLTDEFYGFAVNKGRDDLRLQLNEFMTNNEQKLKELQIAYISGVVEPKMIVSGDENAENALIVATSADFEPFEYAVGNFYSGYDLEVMQMFCEAYGYQLVIKDMNFDAIINYVNLGSAHIGAAALTWSEERAKNVNFTVGYYDATQVIICMADDTTFDDCKSREDVEAILNSLKK